METITNTNTNNNFNNNLIIEENNKLDLDLDLDAAIFRFKFTEEFMEELYKFSKIHQYDHRKDFKEAWNIWIEDNAEIIQNEDERLLRLGYDGETLDKMFKSARYYFRKKNPIKQEPKKRRQYINVPHELLAAMDLHIVNHLGKDDYQPKTGFLSFCIENDVVLKQTVSKIVEQGIKDSHVIQDKLKKTYKNRYFLLTNKK